MRQASQPAQKSGDSARPPSTDFKRRRFLFALSASSVGAAAPALAATSTAEATTEAVKTSGYRETEHIRDYYDSARL